MKNLIILVVAGIILTKVLFVAVDAAQDEVGKAAEKRMERIEQIAK